MIDRTYDNFPIYEINRTVEHKEEESSEVSDEFMLMYKKTMLDFEYIQDKLRELYNV